MYCSLSHFSSESVFMVVSLTFICACLQAKNMTFTGKDEQVSTAYLYLLQ